MPPALHPGNALFLDIDGTLIDLAARPHDVIVPPALPGTLRDIQTRLNGALAVLSGRPMADIDALLKPGLPAGAEHGAVLRDAAGHTIITAKRPALYDKFRAILADAARARPGVLIEEKTYSLAIHYRQVPQYETELRALAAELVKGDDTAVLLPAHMAIEIKPRGGNKGDALKWFMATPHFAGRLPVFIGDDVTDEPAIEAASQAGGAGLHVARDFGGQTAAVRSWLQQFLNTPA